MKKKLIKAVALLMTLCMTLPLLCSAEDESILAEPVEQAAETGTERTPESESAGDTAEDSGQKEPGQAETAVEETKPQPVDDSHDKPAQASDAQPEAATEVQPEAEPEDQPETEPEDQPESEAEVQPKPESEPEREDVDSEEPVTSVEAVLACNPPELILPGEWDFNNKTELLTIPCENEEQEIVFEWNFEGEVNEYIVMIAPADSPERTKILARTAAENVKLSAVDYTDGVYLLIIEAVLTNGNKISLSQRFRLAFAEKSDKEFIGEPAEEPVEEPAEEPADESVGESAETPAEGSAEAASEGNEEPSEEQAEEPAEDAADNTDAEASPGDENEPALLDTGEEIVSKDGSISDFVVTNNVLTTYKGEGGDVVIPEDLGILSIGQKAFSQCSSVTSVVIPGGVTSIGDRAFESCTAMTSVNIPEGVRTIGADAFTGCSQLTSIAMPDSVRLLGARAFSNCLALAEITLSASLTSINEDVFNGCSSLVSVTIPNGVTIISMEAFYGCSSLASIEIPDSVRTIGDSAFRGCSALISVNLPDSVTTISKYAFYDCSSLVSIDIPEGVTSIADSLFWGCSALTSVTIPESVTSIGGTAFRHCSSLASVTLPDKVNYIGSQAFMNCSALTSFVIPSQVTGINGSVFSECTSLTSVTIPDSVTKISLSAFYKCSSLTSVIIPGSVTSIGDSAFGKCAFLTSLTLPDSVTTIGNYAFDSCSNLTSITIPASVTKIGKSAFNACNLLTIRGYTGSYIQSYAQEYNIPFVAIDAEPENPPVDPDEPDPWRALEGFPLWNSLSFHEKTQLIMGDTIYIAKDGVKNLDDYLALWKSFWSVNGGHTYSVARKDKIYTKYISIDTAAGVIKGIKAGKTAYVTVSFSDGSQKRFSLICYEESTPFIVTVLNSSGSSMPFELEVNGPSETLSVLIFPASATNQSVKWSSSNSKVLKVSENGVLTPVKPGKVTVTAKALSGGKAGKISVTVKDSRVPVRLSVDAPETVDLWDNVTIVPRIEPETAAQHTTYKYQSSNKAVAEISQDGQLTLHKTGKAKITVTSVNQFQTQYKYSPAKTSFTLRVTDSTPPSKISINEMTDGFDVLMLSLGLCRSLTYTLGTETERAKVTWTSSKASVVKVDKDTGMLTAVKPGSATITVKTHNGKKGTRKITVYDPIVPYSIKINDGNPLKMAVGAQVLLPYSIFPSTAETSLSWSASALKKQKGVVEVDQQTGLVTAKMAGTTTVTAKTDNKKTANILIQVMPDNYALTIINESTDGSATGSEITWNGDSLKLACTAAFDGETLSPSCTWQSSDSSIAIVDGSGNVSFQKDGVVVITAFASSVVNQSGEIVYLGEKSASVTITCFLPITQKISRFIDEPQWAHETFWSNAYGVQGPKLLTGYNASGCCAYTMDFLAYVFDVVSVSGSLVEGGAELRTSSGNVLHSTLVPLSEARAGDIIHWPGEHWFAVIGREGDGLISAEAFGNQVCISSRLVNPWTYIDTDGIEKGDRKHRYYVFGDSVYALTWHEERNKNTYDIRNGAVCIRINR